MRDSSLESLAEDPFRVPAPAMTLSERIKRTCRGIAQELRWGARQAKDPRSLVRYGADVILYRVMGVVFGVRRAARLPGHNRERRIALRGDLKLSYRLNRGDIEGIREVWVQDTYRLPFDMRPAVVIDLGANIGFTSVFFAVHYQCTTVVAVEPVPANADLARRNLRANSVPGQVVEAAVGPCDGTIGFESHRDSNRGRAGGTACLVPMASMSSILAMTPTGRADLVKIDIEGGEEALLLGDTAWLANVGAVIIEFHPPLVDKPRLVAVLRDAGFRYVPADSVWPRSMECFVRDAWPVEAPVEGRSPSASSR